MDDRASAVRTRPGEPESEAARQRARAWSREPHHRRRRAIAGVALFALAILVGALLALSGGGSRGAQRAKPVPGSFLQRVRTLAGAGPHSLAGGEEADENAAIDRTLAYTPYVRIAGGEHREVALTFDDGPGPYTPRILSLLHKDNVAATFFEVGVLEPYFHSSTSRIVADRDTIGDHTFSHAAMSRLSPADQKAQLLEQAHTVERYGASFPRLFRPPYGMWNAATLALLRRYRMLMVLWTVDTADYRRRGAHAIARAALSGARPGAIILMHDAGGNRSQTVAALPKIISGLRTRGYRFVTVPRLLLDNPAPHDQQISQVIGKGA
jgi:peptidoglycan/xylan/chitin deacetylase (PgdA/CDA1 family)